MVDKMLKVFTLKFNDKIEGFNDEIIYNFLCNKELISWKSYFQALIPSLCLTGQR